MAYMSTGVAAKIRADLKEAFPPADGWKLSVKKSSGNLGIDVTFLEGPFQFMTYAARNYGQGVDSEKVEPMTNCQVNHYHLEHYPPETAKVLEKASAIIHAEHWDESDIMTDYFHCAFYVHIGVGTWEKSYQHVTKAELQAK